MMLQELRLIFLVYITAVTSVRIDPLDEQYVSMESTEISSYTESNISAETMTTNKINTESGQGTSMISEVAVKNPTTIQLENSLSKKVSLSSNITEVITTLTSPQTITTTFNHGSTTGNSRTVNKNIIESEQESQLSAKETSTNIEVHIGTHTTTSNVYTWDREVSIAKPSEVAVKNLTMVQVENSLSEKVSPSSNITEVITTLTSPQTMTTTFNHGSPTGNSRTVNKNIIESEQESQLSANETSKNIEVHDGTNTTTSNVYTWDRKVSIAKPSEVAVKNPTMVLVENSLSEKVSLYTKLTDTISTLTTPHTMTTKFNHLSTTGNSRTVNKNKTESEHENQLSAKETSTNIEVHIGAHTATTSNVQTWGRRVSIAKPSEVVITNPIKREVDSSNKLLSISTKFMKIVTTLTTPQTVNITLLNNGSTTVNDTRVSNEKWHSPSTYRFKEKVVALLGLLGIVTLGCYIFYSIT